LRFWGNKAFIKDMIATDFIAGQTEEERSWDVIVTTYEMCITYSGHLNKIPWEYLVLDEAHRVKNESSSLAKVLRQLHVNYRLLLTGTPLQNNLHELWALLNFLLPEIFHSSDAFDEWFNLSNNNDDENKKQLVQQLHKILKPFMLRRLKADVEKELLPKVETLLYTGFSDMQRDLYKKTLMRDMSTLQKSTVPGRKNVGRSKLCNIVMQLRKVCNHPYLFDGVEDRELDPMGEHLIDNCGKLQLLDKLLAKLKTGGHRVLIFSQMTRLLDILEDYCWIRKHNYCRLDGQTDHDLRTEYIDAFNAPGSDKFLFLLSTRAGGLGINLQTADTVILFDSDWNPQVDLQAQDRAHRIGQKKQVHIYRLLTADTIEEKILERAELKLRMDAVVIQGGRADSSNKIGGDQMLAAIRYGADKVFRGDGAAITDDDIDAIINRGKEKTEAMKKVLEEKAQGDVLDFKLEYTTSLQEFDGVDYTAERKRMEEMKKQEALSFALAMGDAIGKRERKKTNYSEQAYYSRIYAENEAQNAAQQRMRRLNNNNHNVSIRNARVCRPRDYPRMKIWQFFDLQRLAELQEKENEEYVRRCQEATAGTYVVPEKGKEYIFLNEEDQTEKILLLNSGFKWSRHNYRQFIRACANFGRSDLDMICEEMKSASGNVIQAESVKRYHALYFEKGLEVFGEEEWDNNLQLILKGESRVEKIQLQVKDVQTVVQHFKHTHPAGNPRSGLNLIYNNVDTDKYSEENDAFLMCEMAHLGRLGFFDEMRRKIQQDPLFTFDYFFLSRNNIEIERRCKSLLRCAGTHLTAAATRKERRDKAAAKKMKQLANDQAKKELKERKQREAEEKRNKDKDDKKKRKEARELGWAKKRLEKANNKGRRRSRGVRKTLPEGWNVNVVHRKKGGT